MVDMKGADVSTAGNRIRPDMVDRMMDLYCDWRTECVGVQAAYDHFLGSEPSDRGAAFAAYTAALDREESACDVYAGQVRLIMSCWAGDRRIAARRRERCL